MHRACVLFLPPYIMPALIFCFEAVRDCKDEFPYLAAIIDVIVGSCRSSSRLRDSSRCIAGIEIVTAKIRARLVTGAAEAGGVEMRGRR